MVSDHNVVSPQSVDENKRNIQDCRRSRYDKRKNSSRSGKPSGNFILSQEKLTF